MLSVNNNPAYDVPFSSQYADLGHHEWRARGCGIASLKMVMDFWHAQNSANKTIPLDDLLQAGLAMNAYIPDVGWSHRGLAALAQQYGYEAYNVDVAPNSPTPKTKQEAWNMLVAELERGPLLVSVFSRFDPESRSGHIITMTGWDGHLVAFNDPVEMDAWEGKKLLALRTFLPAFKQRFIVVRPQGL
jgi:hypothetical protein